MKLKTSTKVFIVIVILWMCYCAYNFSQTGRFYHISKNWSMDTHTGEFYHFSKEKGYEKERKVKEFPNPTK